MSKIFISIFIVILIIVSAFVYFKNSANAPENTGIINNPPPPSSQETAPPEPPVSSTKTVDIVGKSFSFSPSAISVKKGDPVHINFSDSDGFHDLVIDEYNVRTERINTGGQSSVDFIADKAGTFEYYCSVANHRERGMKGTFIVE